jgi:hypothetical protein
MKAKPAPAHMPKIPASAIATATGTPKTSPAASIATLM